MCDDITRGAEGKEVGRKTCLELVRDKTEPYRNNYPARHSSLGERLSAGLAQLY